MMLRPLPISIDGHQNASGATNRREKDGRVRLQSKLDQVDPILDQTIHRELLWLIDPEYRSLGQELVSAPVPIQEP